MNKHIPLLLIALFISLSLFSQPGYSETYDYVNINKNGMTIPPRSELSVENAYVFSSLHITYALQQLASKYTQLFNNGNADLPDHEKKLEAEIQNLSTNTPLYRMQMRIYSPQMVGERYCRMIIVRPDDNVQRPCVLITHGSRMSMHFWVTYLSLHVADYLMRGYAVAFYEEWNSLQNLDQLANPAYDAWNDLHYGDLLEAHDRGVETDDASLQRAYFMSMQYAHAAAVYLASVADEFNIDPAKIFASGHSAGGLASLMVTFGDSTNNFNHASYNRIGPYSRNVYSHLRSTGYTLQGTVASGAGLPDHTVAGVRSGKFIGPEDNGKVVVMFHGKEDRAADVNYGPGLWDGPTDTVNLMGPLSLKPRFDQNGIHNYTLINCIGEHGVYSYPITPSDRSGRFVDLEPGTTNFLEVNDDSFEDTAMHQLLLYTQQIWDMGWVAAGAFCNKISGKAFSVPSSVFSWTPGQYSNPMNLNVFDWHFIGSHCGIPGAAAEKINGSIITSLDAYTPGDIDFRITPTLARNEIWITTNTPYSKEGTVMIWDLKGQLQYKSPGIDISINNTVIDISNLHSGMYLVSFVGNDESVYKSKIVTIK